LRYDLSLFVVKNLCYIFMLLHSLYPGMVYVLTGKPCGHLVPRYDSVIANRDDVDNTNNIASHRGSGSKSPVSSNEMEMVPMRTPPLNQENQDAQNRRNLNRVSRVEESGDDTTP
jgi:hypothetical protein